MFCGRQRQRSHLAHLSHFGDLDGASQLNDKYFFPSFTFSFNASTFSVNNALYKVTFSAALTEVKCFVLIHTTRITITFFPRKRQMLSQQCTSHILGQFYSFFLRVLFSNPLEKFSPNCKNYLWVIYLYLGLFLMKFLMKFWGGNTR